MTIIPEDKLDGIILKGKELEEQLGQENTSEKFVELSKEYSEIQSLYNASIEWKKFSKEIIDLKNIIEETSDKDIKDFAQEELKDLEDKISKLSEEIKEMMALDKSKLSEMGKNGRAYYDKEFDKNNLLQKLEGIFNSQ